MEQVTLGSYLKSGRERAGVGLDAVSLATKIPIRKLEALEEERLESLPAMVFVKGFVQAYCREVNLDPQPALELLTETLAGDTRDTEASPQDEQPIYLTPPARDIARGLRVSRIILVLAAIALFIAAYVLTGREETAGGPSANATEEYPAFLEHGLERETKHETAAPDAGETRAN